MDQTMSKITKAAASQNLTELETLTNRASELKRMKEQIAAIQHRLIGFAGNNEIKIQSNGHSNLAQRELLIEVSQGMINQNLLTLTEPLKRGQVRIGEELIIEALPSGERFKTVVMTNGNKLQERGAIGKFYREAGVHAGDFVLLREISRGNWQLVKK
ncbi:MAG: hypothetical protein ACREDS_01905 [Limisphaerales bacterium]